MLEYWHRRDPTLFHTVFPGTSVNKGKRKIIAVAFDAVPGYALPAFAQLREGV